MTEIVRTGAYLQTEDNETIGRSFIDPIDVEIGRRISVRRKQLGLTQSELGVAIDVSFQQIQKYERGTNRVASSTLLRLAIPLKVPMSYFFDALLFPDEDGEPSARFHMDAHLDFIGSQEGRHLLDSFLRLPKRLRRKFITLFDTLNETSMPPGPDC